jgi:acid phosphatase (class A)
MNSTLTRKVHASLKNSLAVLALLLLPACATSLPNNGLTNANYPAITHVMLSDILPPPPVAHSVADRQDLAAVLQAQKTRTPEQIKLAQLDAKLSIFRFQSVLGDGFNEQNLPVTTKFFERVMHDDHDLIEITKNYYNRPRPSIASDQVKPVVPPLKNASYPSGHSCFAYLSAILLSRMLPEKAPQIFDRAASYAHNRIVAGVHYPTDVQAGMISASVIVNQLMLDEKFNADFMQAKTELRHKL